MTIKVPFADLVGLEGLDRTSVHGVMRLPQRVDNTNHIGSQHAGALFTVAEGASGAAVMGRFGTALASGVIPLVRGAQIQFLKVARGPITATAVVSTDAQSVVDRLQSDGKVDVDVEVVLTDDSDVKVATVQVQWNFRAARPS